MALRQRKKTFVKSVEDLDAFPKVPESYVEKEASNAIGKKICKKNWNSRSFEDCFKENRDSSIFHSFPVYLVTLFFVIILIFYEFEYFLNPDPKFHFVPDADFEAKLQINIDMTVAMRCDSKLTLKQLRYFVKSILLKTLLSRNFCQKV